MDNDVHRLLRGALPLTLELPPLATPLLEPARLSPASWAHSSLPCKFQGGVTIASNFGATAFAHSVPSGFTAGVTV